MDRKIVLIGLDGVDFDLIDPWIEEGKLPNIATILSNGAEADLETCPPSWTIPNWNAITTGKTPGSLGIYDFMSHSTEDRSFSPYFTVRDDGNPLWQYIEKEGGKSCVANVPSMHIPDQRSGVSVVGWLPADDERTWPPDLQSTLDDLVDGYRLDVTTVDIEKGEVSAEWDDKQAFLKELYTLTEDRIDVFDYLFELEDWDFFMPVFIGTDRINHALWGEEDELCEYYTKIDEWIGSVLDRVDDDTIVGVVSDHGFSGHDQVLYLNDWFERNGFLVRESEGAEISGQIVSKFVNFGREYLPSSITDLIPNAIRDPMISSAETPIRDANIDWGRTTAYCTSVSGTIYVNAENETETAVCDRLIESLEADLQNQGIRPEDFRIYRTRDTYNTLKADPPDLVIELDSVDINTRLRNAQSEWMVSSPLKGNHQRTGLLAFHGDGIQNTERGSANVTDVAPTVLYLLESPIPNDTDGSVLFDLLDVCHNRSPNELATPPLEHDEKRASADQKAIEDRLDSLGYL